MNTQVQNENVNSQNDEVEEVEPLAEDATQDEKDEYIARIESEKNQLYARLKKEQGFVMKDGKWVKPPAESKPDEKPKPTTVNSPELSQLDLITLARTNIEDEDIQEVVEYARFKKISVSEALKAPVIKSMLAEKAEQRKVAEGTSTGPARRGSGKVSDDALISNANSGKLPESDEDITRLVKARLGLKG